MDRLPAEVSCFLSVPASGFNERGEIEVVNTPNMARASEAMKHIFADYFGC